VIDFRYHLVSIVAVFLALAIGIVLGSTELQGSTLSVLRSSSDSLKSQLSAVSAQRDAWEQQANASDTFLQTAEPKLLAGLLSGQKVVLVTEPGAPSAVVDGIEKAAGPGYAGATLTGTVALQPKFNDLSGATQASLSAINTDLASTDGTGLAPAADQQTVYQQEAAQLIASAILDQAGGTAGLTASQAQGLLGAYAKSGYLTTAGTPWDRATLAVIVVPQAAPASAGDPANQVLLAVAGQFAAGSAATLVAGPAVSSASSASAISVLRGSSVSSQVSSVDNADSRLGQVSVIWALADQLAGEKPNSYGISGASAVSPVPLPGPSVTPSATGTPTPKVTGKVKKTVNKT
jgi:hypothetical protein